ncbi:hypothetical protein PT974_10914 [Cladobotryum mycophilum]|uniref:3CxxC-type domain-containing protein n=1 Tax=Cladobotryum mycophilum TaxID=491253 RepID=A0ABR0SB59_9HYPO
MAKKKKPSESKPNLRTSFMFPSLHQDVTNAVSDKISSIWFNQKRSGKAPENEHPTHVMGRFRCSNGACSSGGWASKKVAILIRGYPENGYNAVVFNQHCKACKELGILTLDENSYVERIAYRLKKWAGVPMEPQPFSEKKGLPHKSELCEGCKQGYCQEGYH